MANLQNESQRPSKTTLLIGFVVGDRKTSQLLPWVRLELPHPDNTKVNRNDKRLQRSQVVAFKMLYINYRSVSQVVVLARGYSQEINNIADVDAVVR